MNKVTRSDKPAKSLPDYPTDPLNTMTGWIFKKKSTRAYYILSRTESFQYALINLENGNRVADSSSTPSEVFGSNTWTHVNHLITIEPSNKRILPWRHMDTC